jgi:hypothetical protein
MFGLFKKQVTPVEFGQSIVHLSKDFLASDAGRSLGTQFENWDGSDGWEKFLSAGVCPFRCRGFILSSSRTVPSKPPALT